MGISDHKLPSFSVIICTVFNRPFELRRCLESILGLNYPQELVEVIVVNNSKEISASSLMESFRQKFDKVRYLVYPKGGLAAARNYGIKNSNRSIVAFLDDDCVADRNWLLNLANGYSDPSIVGVGGKIVPKEKISNTSNPYYHLILYIFSVDTKRNQLTRSKFVDQLFGGNFSFRREIFKWTSFDQRLGRRGNILLAGEDIDLCFTLVEASYKLLYTPKAIVYHKVSNNRINTRYLLKWAFYTGLTASYVRRKHTSMYDQGKYNQKMIEYTFSFIFRFFFFGDRGAFYRSLLHAITLFSWLTGLDKIVIGKNPVRRTEAALQGLPQ